MTDGLLPFDGAVKYYLLQRLNGSRPTRPIDLYDALADDLKLISQQRLLKRRTTSGYLWHNRVQTARNHLVKRGFIDASRRGFWSLTPSGKTEADRLARLVAVGGRLEDFLD